MDERLFPFFVCPLLSYHYIPAHGLLLPIHKKISVTNVCVCGFSLASLFFCWLYPHFFFAAARLFFLYLRFVCEGV